MSTLGINIDVRSIFKLTMPLLPLIFVFLSSPPKTLSFSRRPLYLSQKNNDLRLIHHWIIMKFYHHICISILSLSTVGNLEIILELREIHFAL